MMNRNHNNRTWNTYRKAKYGLQCLTLAGVLILPVGMSTQVFAQQGPVNPFAEPAKASWIGQFKGDNIELKLSPAKRVGAYMGKVTFKGQQYSVSAVEAPDGSLSGTFKVQGRDFPFTAVQQNGIVTFSSAGSDHTMKPVVKNEPDNPFKTDDPIKPVQPIKGTFPNQKTFKHSTGYQFNHPGAWTVQETEMGIVITPGDNVKDKEWHVIQSAPAQGIQTLDDPKLVQFMDNIMKQTAPTAQRAGGLTKQGNMGILVYTATNPQTQENFVQKYFISLKDGQIFALSSTAREDIMEKREALLAQIFATFGKGGGVNPGPQPGPDGPVGPDEEDIAVQKQFPNGKLYKHSTGYQFEHPQAWKIQESQEGVLVIPPDLVKDANGQAQESYFFGVDNAQGAKTLNDPKLVAYADAQMKQNIPSIERAGGVEIMGDVGLLTYKFGNEQVTYYMKIYYKLHDGKSLNLVALTRSDLSNKRTSTLLKMMKTFGKGKAQLDQNLKGSWYREGGSHSGGATGNVYTNNQEYIILKADGSAERKTKGSVSASVPNGAGAHTWDKDWNTTKGTWSAGNGILTIQWENGNIFSASYKLFMHDGAPAVKLTITGAEKPLYYKKQG